MVLGQANNEIKHQYLSAAKARDMLGWSPSFSLERSLLETIEWYRSHLETPHRIAA